MSKYSIRASNPFRLIPAFADRQAQTDTGKYLAYGARVKWGVRGKMLGITVLLHTQRGMGLYVQGKIGGSCIRNRDIIPAYRQDFTRRL